MPKRKVRSYAIGGTGICWNTEIMVSVGCLSKGNGSLQSQPAHKICMRGEGTKKQHETSRTHYIYKILTWCTHSPLNQHNPSECQKHVCSLVTTIQTRIPTQSPMRIPTSRRCAAANTPRVMGANDERSWCKQRVQSWSGWRVLAGVWWVWWVWWQSGVATVGPFWGGRLEKSSGYFSS